ncbi:MULTISPECIES: Sec-independent protein translocase TatB [unclassified Amycolatopsis]|uniref:Sec-independent protein translocase TatB n=1 Tax=unclassified Amycolatopsis TaxID=2618356 RepID=UPI002E11CC72|nr:MULTISPECIES: Sec-independent protein translocase TatB [unclassified Amycolatopsis]WSK74936.1 Sec-independent protein translocase TatB [Amycolatopsis sp. NBC_01286]
MFGLSAEHLLVLLVAALFIIGPERLPGALTTVRKAVVKGKNALGAMQQQITDEVGPEFEQLRKPLRELNQLRGMDPRAALTRFVLDPAQTPAQAPAEPVVPLTAKVSGVDMEAT